MTDDRLRELERALAVREDSELRLALADRYLDLGRKFHAAKTIIPLATDERAERIIRTLAGPRPQTHEAAIDMIAHKTFHQTDDLPLRLAYIRQRISDDDSKEIICDLVQTCAQAKAYVSIDLEGRNQFCTIYVSPENARTLINNMHQTRETRIVTPDDAATESRFITLILPAYERLRQLIFEEPYARNPDSGFTRWNISATTIDGRPENSVSYTFRSWTPNALVISLQAAQDVLHNYHPDPHTAGPATRRDGLSPVALLTPKGAR